MLSFLKGFLARPYAAVGATLVLCYLLFSPSENLDIEVPELFTDKAAHCLAFAGLTFLWKQYLKNLMPVIVMLLLFAIFTEIVQYLLPVSFRRSFELNDLLADSIGIAIGLLCSWIFDKIAEA